MLQEYNRRISAVDVERWRAAGAWGDDCFHGLFLRAAELHADAPAVITERASWSFGDLASAFLANRTQLSRASIGPRSVVALQSPNDATFLVAHLAVASLGAVTMTLPSGTTTAEFELLTRRGSVDLAILEESRRSELSAVLPPQAQTTSFGTGGLALDLPAGTGSVPPMWDDPDADAIMVPTAGTTSTPKLAVRTHNAWLAMGRKKLMSVGDIAHRAGEKVFVLSPLAQGVGYLHGFVVPLLVPGVCRMIVERFDPETALDLLARERPVELVGIPAQLDMLAESLEASHADLPSLRYAQTGGDHMPPEKRRRFEDAFRVPVLTDYGASDVGAGCTTRPDDPQEARLTTAGRAMPWTELVILGAFDAVLPPGEDGEIALDGPDLISGYYPDDEGRQGQWFRTGDIGHLDEVGNLVITGRRTDLIIRGGLNISPAEVQDVLLRHPHIRSAAVVGVPDVKLGERIGAFIVTLGDPAALHAGLRRFLSGSGLNIHKWPERVFFVDELPHTRVGKVDNVMLRRRAAEGRGMKLDDAVDEIRASAPGGQP